MSYQSVQDGAHGRRGKLVTVLNLPRMRGIRLSNISGALLLREKSPPHSIDLGGKLRNRPCTQIMEQAAHKGLSQ